MKVLIRGSFRNVALEIGWEFYPGFHADKVAESSSFRATMLIFLHPAAPDA